MSHRLIAAAVATAVLVLQGCAPRTPPRPVVADDLTLGVAKSCSYSPVQPKPGATVEATITMTNDGWCAYRATESEGKAYMLGLVKQRPSHGELLIRKWAAESRVEYNPNPGFAGTDKFEVALRSQAAGVADSLVQITAAVTPGASAAPSAAATPAAEEKKPAAKKSSRASTRRR